MVVTIGPTVTKKDKDIFLVMLIHFLPLENNFFPKTEDGLAQNNIIGKTKEQATHYK